MAKKEEKKEVTQEEVDAKNADLQKRVNLFNAELIPLLGKYKLGLGGSAFLLPDGRVGARAQLFDDTERLEKEKNKLPNGTSPIAAKPE